MILTLTGHPHSWSGLICYEFDMRVDDKGSSQKSMSPRKLSKQVVCDWCKIDTLWISMFVLKTCICFKVFWMTFTICFIGSNLLSDLLAVRWPSR